MGLVALTFDRLTLKWYVSRIKGGEPSLRIRACYKPSGSPAIRYVRDGRTDGRTKPTLTAPFSHERGHNNCKALSKRKPLPRPKSQTG